MAQLKLKIYPDVRTAEELVPLFYPSCENAPLPISSIWEQFKSWTQPARDFQARHLNLKVLALYSKIIYGLAKTETFYRSQFECLEYVPTLLTSQVFWLKGVNGLVKYAKMCLSLDKRPGEVVGDLLNPLAWQKGIKTFYMCLKVFHDSRIFFGENAVMKMGYKLGTVDLNLKWIPYHHLALKVDDMASEYFFGPIKFVLKGGSFVKAYRNWADLPADASQQQLTDQRLTIAKASVSFVAEAIRMGLWTADRIKDHFPWIAEHIPEKIKKAAPFIAIAPTILGVAGASIGLWQYYRSFPSNQARQDLPVIELVYEEVPQVSAWRSPGPSSILTSLSKSNLIAAIAG